MPPLALPMLRPPSDVAYTGHDAAQPIARSDGATVAQLATIPNGMDTVETFLPEQQPARGGIVSFDILATIRYSGGKQVIYVSTVRPSPLAAAQPLGLGNQTVQLADGSVAWADSGLPGGVPNRIVLAKDGLLISVEGNLPLNMLKSMLASLVIN